MTAAADKLMVYAEIFGEDSRHPLLKYTDEFMTDLTVDDEQLELLVNEVNGINNAIMAIVSDGIKSGELKGSDTESITIGIFSMLAGTTFTCLGTPQIKEEDYVKMHTENMWMLLSGIKGD